MKLLKKVLAASLILSLTFSAIPASAASTVTKIDFENGKIPKTVFMLTDDGADKSKLSVKKYDGSKQLFVDVQDGVNMVPKLQINVGDLVGGKNMTKVKTVKFKVTIVNPAKKALGWNGGGFGANIGADGKQWYQDPNGWTLEEYKKASKSFDYSVSFVPGMGFTNGVLPGNVLFMKWAGTENDFYIDNIQVLDKNGKALKLDLSAKATKAKK